MNENGRMTCFSINIGVTDRLYRVECSKNLLNGRPVAKSKIVHVVFDTKQHDLMLSAVPERFVYEPEFDIFSPCPSYIETPGKSIQNFDFDVKVIQSMENCGNGNNPMEDQINENNDDENLSSIEEVGDVDVDMDADVSDLCLYPLGCKIKSEEKFDLTNTKKKINFKKDKEEIEDKENREPGNRRGFNVKVRRPVLVKTSYEEIDQFYDVVKLPVVDRSMSHALRFWLAHKYITETKFSVMEIAVHFDIYYSSLLAYKKKNVQLENNGFLSPGEFCKNTVLQVVMSYGRDEDIFEFMNNKKKK